MAFQFNSYHAAETVAAAEEKQKELLEQKTGSESLSKCDICSKIKNDLYCCSYPKCPHYGKQICLRCGDFLHDEDMDHPFDITKDYIRKVRFDDWKLDLQQIKKRSQEMHLMTSSIKNAKVSMNNHKFIASGTNMINSIWQLENTAIGEYMLNPTRLNQVVTNLSEAYQSGKILNFGNEIKTFLFGLGDESLQITNACKEGAFAAGAVTFGIEFCIHTFRFAKGDTNLKQYGKDCGVSLATTFASMAGNIGGTAVGACIGSIIPGFGTAVGGVLGGFIGAMFASIQTKKAFEQSEYFNDKNDQDYRLSLVKEALQAFGYEMDDISNKSLFNEREIGQRFRTRAKEAHPDRNNGDHNKFCRLQAHYTTLLAIIKEPDNVQDSVRKGGKKLKAITI